jgi:apolipoprotein N-acyltransferase
MKYPLIRHKLVTEYIKGNPIPVIEPIQAGNGIIPVITTPYGKLGSVICFDGDFPEYVNQIGKNDVAILFIPVNEWKEMIPYHAQLQSFRAIENGVSVLRIGSGGVSMGVDYHGRIISYLDVYNTDERVIIADLPINGKTTFYAHFGSLFAQICVLFLVSSLGWIIYKRNTKED